MNNIIMNIVFTDGHREVIDCCDYCIKDNILHVEIRYQETRHFPLCNIKEYSIEH